jgi:hypothetical protein
MSRNYLDFEVKKEIWNKYLLKDGVTLTLKIILINVTLDGTDALGGPQLGFQINNVIGVRQPKEWKELPKDDDVQIEKATEDWNEYKLSNGFLLKFKPIVSQIVRTGTVDAVGNPIYAIQAQALPKLSKI